MIGEWLDVLEKVGAPVAIAMIFLLFIWKMDTMRVEKFSGLLKQQSDTSEVRYARLFDVYVTSQSEVIAELRKRRDKEP